LVVYPTIIYRVLYIPGGFLAGFLNHQQFGGSGFAKKTTPRSLPGGL